MNLSWIMFNFKLRRSYDDFIFFKGGGAHKGRSASGPKALPSSAYGAPGQVDALRMSASGLGVSLLPVSALGSAV